MRAYILFDLVGHFYATFSSVLRFQFLSNYVPHSDATDAFYF